MAILDGDIGQVIRCDRCGKIHDHDHSGWNISWELWNRVIFKDRPKPNLGDFCFECAKEITPLVYQLRDVDELKFFVNKLERAINEKRRKVGNNRAIKDAACECSQRRNEWRFRHRPCIGFAQAGEEHF